ncbi:MAG: fumarylacetoacetase [Actinomycetota bacterium]|nr:fumarylacetoacetase [Actinomycetota bacterium]
MTAGGGSWVPGADGSPFPIENLPYGVFSRPGMSRRVGVAIGTQVLDLAGLASAGLLPSMGGAFARPTLNPFLAEGRPAWRDVRARLTELLGDDRHRGAVTPALHPLGSARLHLPFVVADFVDFYSSLDHATNMGRLLRPGTEPLPANWRHLPAGYHGRSGSIVVSGTPITRPCGQRLEGGAVAFGATAKLDFEAEVGFVVGTGSRPGGRVPARALAEHVFGVVLVNDWSARDCQAWEYVPLGPFLAKSFATSISPWVVPLEALGAARVAPPRQEPPPLPYLVDDDPWALDLSLEVHLNGQVLSRPPFAGTYWTPGQQLAHLTANGAGLRTGDLYASGTVSGPGAGQRGSLIELAENGTAPLPLADGSTRCWLHDGDTVTISATAPGAHDVTIGLGQVSGTIHAAPLVGRS